MRHHAERKGVQPEEIVAHKVWPVESELNRKRLGGGWDAAHHHGAAAVFPRRPQHKRIACDEIAGMVIPENRTGIARTAAGIPYARLCLYSVGKHVAEPLYRQRQRLRHHVPPRILGFVGFRADHGKRAAFTLDRQQVAVVGILARLPPKRAVREHVGIDDSSGQGRVDIPVCSLILLHHGRGDGKRRRAARHQLYPLHQLYHSVAQRG